MSVVRRIARPLRRVLARGSAVLLYHRVADPAEDPWALAVSHAHFAEQMRLVARVARPIPLADLVAARSRGRTPPRAVAVTFDDGYADNLHAALPILERFAVPATFFVTTGAVGTPDEFWWDALEHALLGRRELPDRLELDWRGKRTIVRPDPCTPAPAAGHRPRRPEGRRWRVGDPPRDAADAYFVPVWRLLRHGLPGERAAALEQVRAWSGADEALRATHRALTLAELRTLASGNGVEIGAHTVSHRPLAPLASAEQARELSASRAWLEGELGRRVAGLAYPHGGAEDVSSETVRAARDAGFDYACTAGANGAWDPFRVSRRPVRDWNAEEFHGRLLRWLGEAS